MSACDEAGQQLRIGVHVGDVAISADGDVFGDGVNVTARLSEEAVAGTILASEDVYRQLRQRKEFAFTRRTDRELRERLLSAKLVRLASSGVEPDPVAAWSLVRELGRHPFPEFNVPAAKLYTAAPSFGGACPAPDAGTPPGCGRTM
jgi:hypothetical protein